MQRNPYVREKAKKETAKRKGKGSSWKSGTTLGKPSHGEGASLPARWEGEPGRGRPGVSAISMGFSLPGATEQPASGLAEAVRRRQLLKEGQRPRTDRERLIPLELSLQLPSPQARLSPQLAWGGGRKVTAHSCPFLPHLKPCAPWPLCWQKGSRKNTWGVKQPWAGAEP